MSLIKTVVRSRVGVLFSASKIGAGSSMVLMRNLSTKTQEVQTPYEAFGKESLTLAEFQSNPYFDKSLKKAVQSLGFNEFTQVQQQTILPLLQEEGLVCRAKTGTGKTYSFVIPLLQKILDQVANKNRGRKKASCLVIAPTRDLAQQIYTDFRNLIRKSSQLKTGCELELWTGGTSNMSKGWKHDTMKVIVGTPGRTLANLEDPKWAQHFRNLDYRVFDEADRLLDQGFEDQLNAIDDKLTQLRGENLPPLKTLLFSATINDRVTTFAEGQMGSDFKYINCVDDNAPDSHESIKQCLVTTNSLYESHIAATSRVLDDIQNKNFKAILFLPTVVGVNFMHRALRDLAGRDASLIWKLTGKMTQGARKSTTSRFKTAKRGVLVCTDVAARGLDFKGVTDVIQISPTTQLEDYIHKIGRTGRAGAVGTSTLFLSQNELQFVNDLEKKKKMSFASKSTYEMNEEDQDILVRTKPNFDDVNEYAFSLIGFESSVCDVYRLDKYQMMRDVVSMYRSLLQDDSAKLELRAKLFNMMGLPAELVPDYVEVDNPSLIKRRKSSGFGFGQKQYGRSSNFKSYSNDRYSNDRFSRNRQDRYSKNGGYSSNRNNDRSDWKRNTRDGNRGYNSRY